MRPFIKKHIKLFVSIILVAFVVGAITGSKINFDEFRSIFIQPVGEEKSRSMITPAVDQLGEGVASTLTVIVKPGSGRVLVNINDVLAGVDTQESAKIAAQEAGEYTGVNMETLDVIYSIEADAPIVSGASAGASMTVSTIAAIQDRKLNSKVSMTGGINSEGEVVKVGSIIAKAEAVKLEGIETFLVPKDQAYEKEYQRTVSCENVGSVEICQTKYESSRVNLGGGIGIEILEVSNIGEAVEHLII